MYVPAGTAIGSVAEKGPRLPLASAVLAREKLTTLSIESEKAWKGSRFETSTVNEVLCWMVVLVMVIVGVGHGGGFVLWPVVHPATLPSAAKGMHTVVEPAGAVAVIPVHNGL